jgi:PAS domain-containing protein
MDPNIQSGSTRTEKMFILVNECADAIFDAAPVMMHSIDEDGIFLKVNPKWLSAMGHQTEEVEGHQFTGFRVRMAGCCTWPWMRLLLRKRWAAVAPWVCFAKRTSWFNGNGRKMPSRPSKAWCWRNTESRESS